jgi:hypothetical protein
MLKARMLLSALVVGIAVPAAAHAQLPQVQTSQVKTPQVQVGQVQVPQVQVPPVQVPPVQVPQVPEVPVPDLPEPPPVPVPKPAPKLPAPHLPAPGGPSGGGGDSAPSGGDGGGSSPAAPSGGGGASTSASSGGGTSSGGGSTTTRRSHVVSNGGGEARTRVQRHRAERRLQRAVARLGGCLDDLARDQARVLVLRSGVGAGPPRTRRGVARVMNIRVGQVWRLERRGLRGARAIARGDGCGSAGAGGGTIALASGPGRLDGTGAGPAGDAREASVGPAAANGPIGDGAENGPNGAATELAGESPELAPPDLGSGAGRLESATGTSLWVAASLMLLAALAGFATPSLRDRLREGEATSAGRL